MANVEALALDETEGTCTVRVSCGGDNNFAECSGSICERQETAFSSWVKCDGNKNFMLIKYMVRNIIVFLLVHGDIYFIEQYRGQIVQLDENLEFKRFIGVEGRT